MKAADIIRQISSERGVNSLNESEIDLVPLNDLNVHKREVWNLSLTTSPEDYFSGMQKEYKNKAGYSYKFALTDVQEGLRLCKELSENFGTRPCEMSSALLKSEKPIYLVVHIHPEFSFIPKTDKVFHATQELVLNFV